MPAETSGEGDRLTSGDTINKDFITTHGGSNVYSMSGTYTEGIVIDAAEDDVTINVTGETTFDKRGNKDDYAALITVRRAKSVTVNAEGQTITTAEGGLTFSRCFYAENSFTGTAVLNGAPITGSVTTAPHAICATAAGRLTISPCTPSGVLLTQMEPM